MSEILSRTVFETCLAYQTDAPWGEEVRMLLAHDAALRSALAAAERERDEARSSEEWLAFASMREERDAAASDAAFRLELLRAVVATGTKDPRLDARIAEEVGR